MPTHATIRLEDNALICATRRMRRAMARSIARIGADTPLVAWALPDNHGHLAFAGTREEAAHGAWRIELALQAYRPSGCSPFLRRWLRTSDDYGYLSRMTRYALAQARHHEIQSDPFGESDARVDLLGLRVIAPWARQRVREALPRLTDGWMLEQLGLEPAEVRGWSGPLEAGDGLEHLAEAAAATFALPSLAGSRADRMDAKAAAILACAPTVPPGALAVLLRCSPGTVWRIRNGEGAAAARMSDAGWAVRAVAVQARWRARWAGRRYLLAPAS